MFDIAIIGGGVVGCLIARELSQYHVSVCLIERAADVAEGTTKANSAIVHPGFYEKPGKSKARLNVMGNAMMDELCRELHVSFRRCGSLLLAFDKEQKEKLYGFLKQGEENNVPGLRILSGDEVRAIEPNVSPEVIAALYAPSAGITCPYQLAIGAAEVAVQNGTEILLEREVIGITKRENHFEIATKKGETITARVVVNAAGVYSDEINNMVGNRKFHINPIKGEYCLLDNCCEGLINHVLFQTPSGKLKGILATPTVDGNILLGPTEAVTLGKEDLDVGGEGIAQIRRETTKMVPSLPFAKGITSFAGLRAISPVEDFIIGEAEDVKGFINAAAIESPGLTSSPAIAMVVTVIIDEACMKLIRKREFKKERRELPHFRELSETEKEKLTAEDPAYGRIVCRCEMVSEAEIVDAIHRCFGRATLDAVKRRTRAGMGRCQGGFCSPRVVELIAREQGIPREEVTKCGGDSWILCGRVK